MNNETYNEILNFATQDLPHGIGTIAALLLLLVLLVPILFWLIPELFKLAFAFGIFIARKKKVISLMILGLIVIVLVTVAAFKFKPWEMNSSNTANITNSASTSSVSNSEVSNATASQAAPKESFKDCLLRVQSDPTLVSDWRNYCIKPIKPIKP